MDTMVCNLHCKAGLALTLLVLSSPVLSQSYPSTGGNAADLDIAATIAHGLVGTHEERVQSIGTMIECSAYFSVLSSRGFTEKEAESLVLMSQELSLVASALWGSYTPSGIKDVKLRETDALHEWNVRFQQGFERSPENVDMFYICDQAFIAAAAFRKESLSSP